MASVTIDGKEYNLDDLSDKAKENLRSLQFTQGEMQKLQASLAIYNTAAAAYSTALKNELDE